MNTWKLQSGPVYGLLQFISGPVCAGKNEVRKGVCLELRNRGFRVVLVRTSTTRPRTGDETEENDQYIRRTHEEFAVLDKQSAFVESNDFAGAGHRYGLEKAELVRSLTEADIAILEINVDGMEKVERAVDDVAPHASAFVIPCPVRCAQDVDEVERILRARNAASLRPRNDVDRRMLEMRRELRYLSRYGYVIENKDGGAAEAITTFANEVELHVRGLGIVPKEERQAYPQPRRGMRLGLY